ERQQLFKSQSLLDDRLELIVDKVDRVNFSLCVQLNNIGGYFLRMSKIQARKNIYILRLNRNPSAPVEIAAFSTNQHQFLASIASFGNEILGGSDDVG